MSYATAKTPIFLMTALALSLSLTACNRTKKADTTTVASSTATTSTTTVTEISSATATTLASAPASTTDGTFVASGVGLTSAPAMTASATAMTALQLANVGDPKTSVKNVMEGLRTGRVTYAMGFIQSDDKNLKKVLIDSLPMYKDIKSIKYAEPLYDDDKTRAIVKAIITTKSSKVPVQTAYGVQKTMTGWKMLQPTTVQPAMPTMAAPNGVINGKTNGKNPAMPSMAVPTMPIKLRTDTVVTSKTKAGTPEDTLKQAVNTMIKAPTSEAVKFYSNTQPTNIAATPNPESIASSKNTTKKGKKDQKAKQDLTPPPPTLEEKVAMQQALFIQTLQNVKIGKTQYNKDKTEAVVSAVFTPFAKTGSKPQNLEVKMKKEKDGWKIISE